MPQPGKSSESPKEYDPGRRCEPTRKTALRERSKASEKQDRAAIAATGGAAAKRMATPKSTAMLPRWTKPGRALPCVATRSRNQPRKPRSETSAYSCNREKPGSWEGIPRKPWPSSTATATSPQRAPGILSPVFAVRLLANRSRATTGARSRQAPVGSHLPPPMPDWRRRTSARCLPDFASSTKLPTQKIAPGEVVLELVCL